MSKKVNLIQHEIEKPIGKGSRIVRTPLGFAFEDQSSAIAKAFNEAKLYPNGNVIVTTDLPFFTSAEDVKKELVKKVEAEQTQLTQKALKKVGKMTDAERVAFANAIGVNPDVLKPKTEAKTEAKQTEAKQTA